MKRTGKADCMQNRIGMEEGLVEKAERKQIVRCPCCNWRLLDTVMPATGTIEIKCSRCGQVVEIDLSLYRYINYRAEWADRQKKQEKRKG